MLPASIYIAFGPTVLRLGTGGEQHPPVAGRTRIDVPVVLVAVFVVLEAAVLAVEKQVARLSRNHRFVLAGRCCRVNPAPMSSAIAKPRATGSAASTTTSTNAICAAVRRVGSRDRNERRRVMGIDQ
jgi:hypothetical protein